MAGRSASVTDPEVVGPGEGFSSQRASLEQITRGEIDIQIATARRFPRSITAFHTKAISLVTLSKEIAESCIYALPRKDRASGQTKMIKGPSIRFAEIVQSSYQNIRSLAQPVGEEAGFVTVRGLAWDIENNSVIGVETRRKITTSSGHRYSDDMVTTTVNAGSSIVLRNAILHVIPQPLWMPIYEAAVKHAVGDQKTLSVRRQDAIEFFKKLGVPPQRVFARLGVAGIAVETPFLKGGLDKLGVKLQLQPTNPANRIPFLTSGKVDLVLVSPEVGLAVIPETRSGRLFRDEIGMPRQDRKQLLDLIATLTHGCDLLVLTQRQTNHPQPPRLLDHRLAHRG